MSTFIKIDNDKYIMHQINIMPFMINKIIIKSIMRQRQEWQNWRQTQILPPTRISYI